MAHSHKKLISPNWNVNIPPYHQSHTCRVHSSALLKHAVPVPYPYRTAPEGCLNAPNVNRNRAKLVWKHATVDHFLMWSRACSKASHTVPRWAPERKPTPYPIGMQCVAHRSQVQSVLKGYHGGLLWFTFHKSVWTLAKGTTLARFGSARHGTVRFKKHLNMAINITTQTLFKSKVLFTLRTNPLLSLSCI